MNNDKRLNEMVLLSTQKHMFKLIGKKIINILRNQNFIITCLDSIQ